MKIRVCVYKADTIEVDLIEGQQGQGSHNKYDSALYKPSAAPRHQPTHGSNKTLHTQRFGDLADWQQLSFAAVALVDPHREQVLQDFQAVAGSIPRG